MENAWTLSPLEIPHQLNPLTPPSPLSPNQSPLSPNSTKSPKAIRRKSWCNPNNICKFCKDYYSGGNLRQACMYRPQSEKKPRRKKKDALPRRIKSQDNLFLFNSTATEHHFVSGQGLRRTCSFNIPPSSHPPIDPFLTIPIPTKTEYASPERVPLSKERRKSSSFNSYESLKELEQIRQYSEFLNSPNSHPAPLHRVASFSNNHTPTKSSPLKKSVSMQCIDLLNSLEISNGEFVQPTSDDPRKEVDSSNTDFPMLEFLDLENSNDQVQSLEPLDIDSILNSETFADMFDIESSSTNIRVKQEKHEEVENSELYFESVHLFSNCSENLLNAP